MNPGHLNTTTSKAPANESPRMDPLAGTSSSKGASPSCGYDRDQGVGTLGVSPIFFKISPLAIDAKKAAQGALDKAKGEILKKIGDTPSVPTP